MKNKKFTDEEKFKISKKILKELDGLQLSEAHKIIETVKMVIDSDSVIDSKRIIDFYYKNY